MNLSDYNPTCPLDFELLIDRWVDAQRSIIPTDGISKEDHLKEIMIECFKIGYKAGQMPINKPIDLRRICSGKR